MKMKCLKNLLTAAIVSSALLAIATDLDAQNINVATPTTSISDSFHENHGVNFGFSIPGGRGNGSRVVGLSPTGQILPNLMFTQGAGVGSAFGGYDPNSSGRFGFGNQNFSLGFDFSKGSTRTLSNTTPSLTVQNGFGGSMFDGTYRPFATSVTPIIGGYPVGDPYGGYNQNAGRFYAAPDNAVTRALASGQLDLSQPSTTEPIESDFSNVDFGDPNSSAMHGDLPVSEIKAARAKAIQLARQQFEKLLDEAESAELQVDYATAVEAYREMLKMVNDKPTKEKLRSKIRALSAAKKSAGE
jgi:hypothetical protein